MNKSAVFDLNNRFNDANDFSEFYRQITLHSSEHQIYTRRRQGLQSIRQDKENGIEEMKKRIENKLRSKDSQVSHFLIRQLITTKPDKREGAIMNCYIDEKDQLVTHQQQILDNIIFTLGQLLGLQDYDPQPLPTLEPISFQKFKKMQECLSQNKALTEVLISDTWIAQKGQYHILNDLWNRKVQDMVPHFGQFRIVPLNKAFPDIPNKNEFRPITILSPLYKWLELRFQYSLSEYCQKKLIREQVGFVKGMSTHVHIIWMKYTIMFLIFVHNLTFTLNNLNIITLFYTRCTISID